MTKDEVEAILRREGQILIKHMYFAVSDNGIYANCYSDCNCCMDTFATFDEFWEVYGYLFKGESPRLNRFNEKPTVGGCIY